MDQLVDLNSLSEPIREHITHLVEWGVLSIIRSGDGIWATRAQLDNALKLHCDSQGRSGASQLFPSEVELYVGAGTSIIEGTKRSKNEVGGEILLQLLPELMLSFGAEGGNAESEQIFLQGSDKAVYSANRRVAESLRLQQKRIQVGQASRVGSFARAAHYMGSKLTLGVYLTEVLRTRLPVDGIVVDLMCGSGATTGFFSRDWKTYSSDAQRFSRLLAKVQGGGFDVCRADRLLGRLLPVAREHYAQLGGLLSEEVIFEERVLASEISPSLSEEYARWVMEYPRVSEKFPARYAWMKEGLESRAVNPKAVPYFLFSSYYANLFFGVRQAIEIDSLRFAIDQEFDVDDHEWALGALICAVSACADNHGGHFAQPRVKIDDILDIQRKMPKTLLRRSMSVFQEFTARLLDLAAESSNSKLHVSLVDGPWDDALKSVSEHVGTCPVVVYLDPPYTRDEYSRYYHLLETLVLYNYPKVGGKALVPERGSSNRFSSEFFTRKRGISEQAITKIISQCLGRGWSVLWSYADTATADIKNIITNVQHQCRSVDLFSTKFSYSNQGRKGRSAATESLVFLSSASCPSNDKVWGAQ